MSPATSTRWCPTTEQLMILEEMYKSGIRTPNATQIQQITSHLSFYGKIEGKNVFYWFQNHKARDRQKLRRKLITRSSQHQQQQMMSTHHDHHHLLHHHQASSTAACLQQFPHFNSSASTHFLHHPQQEAAGMVLVQEEEPSHDQVMMMNNKWKFDNIPERVLVDQMMEKSSSSTTMMYGRDWMMMMDVDPTVFQYPACCNTNINKQPLKTLELFPVKSTNFKEECTTSNHNILSLSLQPPPNYQMMLHDHH